MGLSILEQVVSALRTAGFRTQRAYPGAQMPGITEVVAAVQLSKMNVDKQDAVIEVKMVGPQHLGAAACEDAAVAAVEVLHGMKFSCVIEAVAFDGRSGLFCASCIATKPAKERIYIDVPFKINSVIQNRVVSFTAQKQTDEVITQLSEAPWMVRVEQFTPNGREEDTDSAGETFTLTNGKELYQGCKWTSCRRITERDGLRQIREGTATSRTIE